MKLIAVLLGVMLSCVAVAQVIEGYSFETQLQELVNPSPHLMRERKGGTPYGTIGSPFILEDYVTGNVFFSNKMRSSVKMINYNCHDNEVLYSDGTDTYLLDTKMVDYLEFNVDENTSWIFKQVFLEDKKKRLFLQVLYNDHSILYKRHFKEFNAADYGGAYSADRRYDEYIDKYDYYISVKGTDIQEFKPRKKNILSIMEAFGKEMEEFLKNEKINLKSEEDLVRLLGYYDSLSTRSQ